MTRAFPLEDLPSDQPRNAHETNTSPPFRRAFPRQGRGSPIPSRVAVSTRRLFRLVLLLAFPFLLLLVFIKRLQRRMLRLKPSLKLLRLLARSPAVPRRKARRLKCRSHRPVSFPNGASIPAAPSQVPRQHRQGRQPNTVRAVRLRSEECKLAEEVLKRFSSSVFQCAAGSLRMDAPQRVSNLDRHKA